MKGTGKGSSLEQLDPELDTQLDRELDRTENITATCRSLTEQGGEEEENQKRVNEANMNSHSVFCNLLLSLLTFENLYRVAMKPTKASPLAVCCIPVFGPWSCKAIQDHSAGISSNKIPLPLGGTLIWTTLLLVSRL